MLFLKDISLLYFYNFVLAYCVYIFALTRVLPYFLWYQSRLMHALLLLQSFLLLYVIFFLFSLSRNKNGITYVRIFFLVLISIWTPSALIICSRLILVSPPLNEMNYHTWSINMKRALLSKTNWSLLMGVFFKPINNDLNVDVWERCNVMVLSWIKRTLTPQFVKSVVYINVVKNLWKIWRKGFLKEITFGSHIFFKKFTILNKVKEMSLNFYRSKGLLGRAWIYMAYT